VASEIAEFPLPADVTADERATAKREIGQTGPVWHFQYTRLYQLPHGFLVAAHDLHEGIKVSYADTPEGLPKAFENETVREFIEEELRFRKILGPEHARAK